MGDKPSKSMYFYVFPDDDHKSNKKRPRRSSESDRSNPSILRDFENFREGLRAPQSREDDIKSLKEEPSVMRLEPNKPVFEIQYKTKSTDDQLGLELFKKCFNELYIGESYKGPYRDSTKKKYDKILNNVVMSIYKETAMIINKELYTHMKNGYDQIKKNTEYSLEVDKIKMTDIGEFGKFEELQKMKENLTFQRNLAIGTNVVTGVVGSVAYMYLLKKYNKLKKSCSEYKGKITELKGKKIQ